MDFRRIDIPTKGDVKALCWHGDVLVDWVAGGAQHNLDGTIAPSYVNWGYRFDAAVRSPSGRFVAIFERLGTKGLLLREGKLLRELNRSFYHADAYEFPIVFAALPNGRELLIHCPDEYCRLEIEDADTGERLTNSAGRKPADFFHSRLSVIPNGKWLLSAGWVWHPCDMIGCFQIGDALSEPKLLDRLEIPGMRQNVEINSATFLDNDRLLVASGPDADDFDGDDSEGMKPGHFAVFNLCANQFESVQRFEGTLGTITPVGHEHFLSMFEHPKLVNLRSGEVVAAWPDINSGKQNSSIIWHLDPLPAPTAFDSSTARFAIAQYHCIAVFDAQAESSEMQEHVRSS